ncbi:MAG TPA: DUF2127 domain-containing protein [Gemmatimonadaceae bacterium]|nr:DUF2127 domain-containing protein [Gemmatimonadaceae bacterium]
MSRAAGDAPASARVVDRVFTAGVVLKGLDGALEVAGGLTFLFVDPRTLNAAIRFLTAHELSEDPGDVVANALRRAAAHLSAHLALLAALYLVGHGAAKLLVVSGLLRRRAWAFPTALVLIGGFVVYQSYRVALGHSLAIAALTALDLVVLWAVWREYRMLRADKRTATVTRRG